MADTPLENGAVVLEGGMTRALIGFAGAASSILLVAGSLWWGYELSVRDVTGVPVVRALEGPARVQPEDPGGRLAEHQGLAVNRVQAEGSAAGPAPRIVLAPDPIELQSEDIVLPEMTRQGAAEPEPEPQPTLQPQSETFASTDEAVEAALALAAEIEASDAEIAPIPAVQRVSLAVPGVKASPRPDLRPEFVHRAIENISARAQDGASLPPTAVAASDIAPGTRLVQLGAFDDLDTAQAAWLSIRAEFSDYMSEKTRVIQEANSGGRKFYRLRVAGFDGLSASRRFCAVLRAAETACIPVTAR